MEQLSRSEEQVMAALWACSRAATRREIASHLPPECRWADSTLLNFLLRLEKKNFVRTEKQGNKNLYTPLVRRLTYCGAVSQAHLQTLYGGDIRAMVCALADTGRMTYADTERLLRWLTEYQAANPEYDYSSSKPSPSGEGGPAGPDEGQPTAITRKRSAAIHSALISPLGGQLPLGGSPIVNLPASRTYPARTAWAHGSSGPFRRGAARWSTP